jgi:hypothetical protein
MVFPEFESGAGRKPMKTMAQVGPVHGDYEVLAARPERATSKSI